VPSRRDATASLVALIHFQSILQSRDLHHPSDQMQTPHNEYLPLAESAHDVHSMLDGRDGVYSL